MPDEFDLVVLGAGTGGYTAAIRAAQLGNTVAIVESSSVGGTCLHKGCIPSKALLRSAEIYSEAKDASQFGVECTDVKLNFPQVQARKEAVVEQLHQGVQSLLAKNNIKIYEGYGRILGPSIFAPSAGSISVEKNDGSENEILLPKNVVIATGSNSKMLPGLQSNDPRIMTSDAALAMRSLPDSLLIIGGGVIGIEWASMFSDFGVDVTVLEAEDRILANEDSDISREMKRQLEMRGVNIVLSATVSPDSIKSQEDALIVTSEVAGEAQSFRADRILVSIGREANITNIGLQNTDIQIENGKIVTNEWGQTKEAHIYAIGDVVGHLELAHVASYEGITAIEHMNEMEPAALNYIGVPRCTYSRPEVASVGYTEAGAVEADFNIKVETFPFQANGKALIHGDKGGFCKIIADKETNDLLGVHLIGKNATEIIAEGSLALFLDAADWEVSETVHPHPSLSEAVKEATYMLDKRAIHI